LGITYNNISKQDLIKINIIPITREELNSNKISLNQENAGIIHLAGKAHDLKNTANEKEYFDVNTRLTKNIFDKFINSNLKVFIFLSSVKAVADKIEGVLYETSLANPISAYGKSKLLAEQYILNKEFPFNKHVYILRPCMIHGPGNKGNLNLLIKIFNSSIPWPLGSFQNKRSFCSIENLCFVINELLQREDINSGIYQVCDDEAISTNELINILASVQNKKYRIFNLPKSLIRWVASIGDILHLPLNSERLQKLTENYIVSNNKIVNSIGRPLPISTRNGLIKTFNSFH
jgi:nucleoside-diphosphate-sugar epimerase